MSQQVENSDILLRPLEPNTNNNANRLPLRKRIGPVLKWQPVETPEEHYKQKIPYPQQQQQQYPFSSSSSCLVQEDHSVSDYGGDTTETDEEKLSTLTTSTTSTSKSLLKKQYESTTSVKQDGKRVEKEEMPANRVKSLIMVQLFDSMTNHFFSICSLQRKSKEVDLHYINMPTQSLR
jgi:Mg2+ and Co2+ transporter CorA